MADPHIAQKSPIALEVVPGTYWFCSCGLSKGQPFCDGSHKGTEFVPTKTEITEAKKSLVVRVQTFRQRRFLRRNPFKTSLIGFPIIGGVLFKVSVLLPGIFRGVSGMFC